MSLDDILLIAHGERWDVVDERIVRTMTAYQEMYGCVDAGCVVEHVVREYETCLKYGCGSG